MAIFILDPKIFLVKNGKIFVLVQNSRNLRLMQNLGGQVDIKSVSRFRMSIWSVCKKFIFGGENSKMKFFESQIFVQKFFYGYMKTMQSISRPHISSGQ